MISDPTNIELQIHCTVYLLTDIDHKITNYLYPIPILLNGLNYCWTTASSGIFKYPFLFRISI